MSCETCKEKQTQGSIPGNVFYEMEARNERTIRRLIDGITFERLAEQFDLSVRQTKTIVYKSSEQLFRRVAY